MRATPGRGHRRTAALIAISLLAGLAPAATAATPLSLFDANLIANPGAERGAGSPSSIGGVVPVPGWTTSGNFTVVEYETQPNVPDSFPTYEDAGPADRGTNLFVGGPENASSSARQAIPVGSAARLIDSGLVSYSLAGWFGGFATQDDNAVLTATFRRANGQRLDSVAVGGVTAADRGGATGLMPRSAFGAVPAGTRQIEVVLLMTKDATFRYNDGYADNLTLVLTNLFGSNLVRNPGAELGASDGDFAAVVDVPGWSTSGNFTVGPWGAEGFPGPGDPGPDDRGTGMFIGGPSSASSSATQRIDVSAGRRLIDTGIVSWSLSAYLGGWTDQNDNAVVIVRFENGAGDVIGSADVGPVTAADRGDETGLLERSSAGDLPAGTRTITVALVMTRDAPAEFTYNDGSADNLRLVLLP